MHRDVRFSLRHIADPTASGIFTLTTTAYVFVILLFVYTYLEHFFFWGNERWNNGAGLYLSIAGLAIFVLISFLLFHRRTSLQFEWLTKHLLTAWMIFKWQWITMGVFLITVFAIMVLYGEKIADFDETVDVAVLLFDILMGLIFVPWTMVALLGLRDEVIMYRTSNAQVSGVTQGMDDNSATEEGKPINHDFTFSDLLKGVTGVGIVVAVLYKVMYAENYCGGRGLGLCFNDFVGWIRSFL